MRELKASPPLALVGGFIVYLARRCWSAPRLLLTHSATEPEIHVIAAAAGTEPASAPPSTFRRRSGRRITINVLPASPRTWPQTT